MRCTSRKQWVGVMTLSVAVLVAGAVQVVRADGELTKEGFTKGEVKLSSAGPLAFGPEGILLVGDPMSAVVYAIATGETEGNPAEKDYHLENIDAAIAAALGVTPQEVLINDLAVNPASGMAYLSVSRGTGPDGVTVLLRVEPSGDIAEIDLSDVQHARAELPNAPANEGQGRQNRRTMAITDLKYVDGRVIVAGLSNEEFASTLRSIPFPFSEVDQGAGVEIFHGAHGRFETSSPVRTFASYVLGDEPQILAAYTCTPLVKFPLSQLTPGAKVRGVTVAELGNRNQPLDMFVYTKDGEDFILMANSRRGVMKISTEGLEGAEGIEKRIEDTAGQDYVTVEGWTNVMHLDRLNDEQALLLSQTEAGSWNLFSAPLP
jgi:hypothetical protein